MEYASATDYPEENITYSIMNNTQFSNMVIAPDGSPAMYGSEGPFQYNTMCYGPYDGSRQILLKYIDSKYMFQILSGIK